MLDQIKNLSYQMRLFGIHESCERRAAEAVAGALHPLEFLRLVLEEELLSRKDRASKMLVTRARFRFSADLEDWDTSFDRGVTRQKMKELALLSFFHNRENLLIVGKTGEGKTHLRLPWEKDCVRKATRRSFYRQTFSSRKSRRRELRENICPT